MSNHHIRPAVFIGLSFVFASLFALVAYAAVSTGGSARAAGSDSVTVQISSGENDAYHDPVGWPHYRDNEDRILAGAPGVNGPTYAGWRWENLGIPANAIITNAYVELNQKGYGFEFQTTLTLEDNDAPGPFTRQSSPVDRWQDRTEFETAWEWSKGVPGANVRTPDLAAGIQELVDTYSGIDAVVMVESGDGVTQNHYHEWRAFEDDPSRAATLHVEWIVENPEPTQSPLPGGVWINIDSGNDDAYDDPLGWPNYRGNDDRILAGAPGAFGPTYGGWRWDDIGIPANATITGAYVELTQHGYGFKFDTQLALQDDAAPESFTRQSSPADRWQDVTAFSAAWAWPKSRPGNVVQTPDLAAGVQELVDRYGGIDAIVLLESGSGVKQGRYHEWKSYETDPSQAARLRIEWTVDDTSPTATTVPTATTIVPTATLPPTATEVVVPTSTMSPTATVPTPTETIAPTATNTVVSPTSTTVPPTATIVPTATSTVSPTPTSTSAPDSLVTNWDGIGNVVFVGPSQDPAFPTTASAEFVFDQDGVIDQVVVTTQNEFVAGVLIGPQVTSAVTSCTDSDGGVTCARLATLLTGTQVSSLHMSVATLDDIVEIAIPVPVTLQDGSEIVLDVPLLIGGLTGQIQGAFVIGSGADSAFGTATLEILPGSMGSYACIMNTGFGPLPLESLEPCMDPSSGAELFPLVLDVVDSGTFHVGNGTGSLSELVSLAGNVEVHAISDLLNAMFGGEINISGGTAELTPLAP